MRKHKKMFSRLKARKIPRKKSASREDAGAELYVCMGPQTQLGTPPMRGQNMTAMLQLSGFRTRPSGKKLHLFCHTRKGA